MIGPRLVLAGLILTAAAAASLAAPRLIAWNAPTISALESLPMVIGPWHGQRDPDIDPNLAAVLGADQYLLRSYAQGSADRVRLYVAFYATQRRGATMHSPLNCLPGSGWDQVERSYVDLQVPGRAPATINRYIVQKGSDREAVFYWFQSRGRVVASEYASKLYLLRDALMLGRNDAALVRVMTPLDARSPNAAATGLAFARDVYPLLENHLPG
jgi:EpsI family protein